MKKLIAILLTLLIIITAFAGCGNTGKDDGNSSDENNTASANSDSKSDSKTETTYSGTLTVEKIGSIDLDNISTSDSGLYYQDDSKMYGVMSFDGKSDTGAKYEYCSAEDNYFVVATDYFEDANNISALNCCGLIDGNGKEIIPEKYADINILNERYAQACEATGSTDSKDDALIYLTSNRISLSAVEGDLLYTGNWYIYDLTNGKMLDGVTGTNKYVINAYGNYVKYVTDDLTEHIVNDDGKELPQDADLFNNGAYALNGAVYDTDDNKLFDYDVNSYVPFEMSGDYYMASLYENGTFTYVLMDDTGKTIGTIFNDYPEVYGELIFADDKIYDFSGKQVIDGTYKNVYYDEFLGNCWILRNDDIFTFIEKDGTVIYQCSKSDGIDVDYQNFLIYKNVDGSQSFYCFADKDFTISGGYNIDTWLVAKTDYEKNEETITDVITGDVILDGYKGYSSIRIDDCIYVYAEKTDGGLDIYTVR